MSNDRLTVLDSAFVQLETPTQPMHVGHLAIAEGEPFVDAAGRFRLDAVRQAIAARLHLVPRFRQRLVPVPFRQGRSVWADDPRFDVANHVQLTALPAPGDEAQLKELTARLQAAPLDRRQPLWELWFVEGLEGGRVAMIQKTHHAMADGVSGVDVANALFDQEPEAEPVEAPPWEPERTPTTGELVAGALARGAARTAKAVGALPDAVRNPALVAERAARVARLARTWTTGAPATSLNVPIGPGRRFEVVRTDLRYLRRIKRPHGCAVNDVLLAAVAGGLRHLLEARGELTDGLTLKAMVPVSMRARTERGSLGNQLSAVLAELPVGEADPVARLRAVAADMARHKEAEDWVDAQVALAAVGYLPVPLVAGVAGLLPRRLAVNLPVTNVPGPRKALYFMGAKIHEVFPYLGPVAGMALMVTILRYDGRMFFGLCADRDAVPDLAVLAEGIEKDLAALAGE